MHALCKASAAPSLQTHKRFRTYFANARPVQRQPQTLLRTCVPPRKASQRPHLVHTHSVQCWPCSHVTHTPPKPRARPHNNSLQLHMHTPCKASPARRSQTHTPVQRHPCPHAAHPQPGTSTSLRYPPPPPRCHPGVARTHTCMHVRARARPGVGRGRGQSRRRACPSPAAARPRRAAGTQTSRDRGARGPALTTCSPPPTGVRHRPSHSPSGAAEDCNSQRAPRGGATPPSP